MIASSKVAAVVLAAGRSTRMAPSNKLLLPDAQGQAMVARVASACSASRVAWVIVVTGHQADLVTRAVRRAPVRSDTRFAHAAGHATGLSASLRAGLAALPQDADAVLVCLGDMPLVTGRMIDRLLSMYDPDEGRLIVLPTFRGKQGNPMLWDRRFFAEMMALEGDRGARALLRHHAEWVAEVETDASVMRDFDTAESLATWAG